MEPATSISKYPIMTCSFRGIQYEVDQPDHPTWADEICVRDALWNVQEGDCIFDIGAALGSYSLAALSAGAKQVFCWDPSATWDTSVPIAEGSNINVDSIRQSLKLNGWEDKCVAYNYGLHERYGWLDTTGYQMQMVSSQPSMAVIPVKRLDDWYESVFKPQYGNEKYHAFWMKIDVESVEEQVLRGAEHLLKELKPYILVENHQFVRNTIDREVAEYVLSLGCHGLQGVYPYNCVSHSLFVPLSYPEEAHSFTASGLDAR